MRVRTWLESWPVFRQLTGDDPLGRGTAAQSPRSRALEPRTATADHVTHSVCPYCAVGCGQRVYVKTQSDGTEKVVQVEGNPASPISRGRLCPKGSASLGGAALDNEENYLIKKLFTALGAIQIENQARI